MEVKAKLILKRGVGRRLLDGHLWVYRSEIAKVTGLQGDGDPAEVWTSDGKFLGRGFFNGRSTICLRIFSWGRKETLDEAFFRGRLDRARAFRDLHLPGAEAIRIVYSEGDILPGLIVDRYGAGLVLQCLTMGMDRRREEILRALREVLKPEWILERSDTHTREREGLPLRKGPLLGEVPEPLVVSENGVRFRVDPSGGQKTGLYLDQRENRLLLRKLAKGRRVLDCFCYTGGFALAAARGGAREVIGVDTSAEALSVARENARLNRLSPRLDWVHENAFDCLRALDRKGERFELVVLDPPQFTRSRKAVEGALRGYKEINLRALKLLSPGGLLLTFTCSHHVGEGLFRSVVLHAAADTKKRLRVLRELTQSVDHPVLLAVPETKYLKGLLLEVLE